MYDELVKDLRENHDKYFARDMQAADAIEELQKQLREEKVDNVNLTGWLAEEHAKVEELQGELQALKDDTDMAIVEDGKTTRLCFVKKWIPVTERLPRKDDDVLLWSEWTGVSGTIYKDISLSSFSEITNMGYKVTHWMPLPQPPESEGE